MKFKPFALLAFVATVGLVACDEDPTDEGRAEPFAIVANRSQATVARNAPLTITAYTIDANNRRVAGELTASPAGSQVVIDSIRYISELTETRIFVRGVAASAAGTDVTITGHGLSTTTKVIVN